MAVQVAVCGPRSATADEQRHAHRVGQLLAQQGAVVVCGGGGGVMAAVAAGARSAGGTVIGVRPDTDRSTVPAELTAAVMTGMGEARNAIIVASADAVIAVGGSWGTLSEIALAMRRGDVPVVSLGGWQVADAGGRTLAGPVAAASPEEAVAAALAGVDAGVAARAEVLDIVDEQDRVVGQASRARAYAERLRHRCVFVLVRDGSGRIFVHKRPDSKQVFPSRYDMFVGGVVRAGESYERAALREAEEELGVSGLPAPTPLGKFLFDTPEHTWWCGVYEVRCEQPVAPPPDEVVWHTFLTDQQLRQRLDEWQWADDSLQAFAQLHS